MAVKHDFDLIIAGDGVWAWALGRMAAFRKLEVLIAPPMDKIPPRKDTFFFSPDDLGILKEMELPGHWDNSRISEGGFYRKGYLESHLPDQFRTVLSAEELERIWISDNPPKGLRREEGLDIKAVREEDGSVILEGLSPQWSFSYRSRFLVVFTHHKAVRKLLDMPVATEPVFWSLWGDFENHLPFKDCFRSFTGPGGAVETWLAGKNTRRYVLPLEKPVEPYTTEILREVLPPLTGVPLEEKRRVGEGLWTLPSETDWVSRKGRVLFLAPEGCTYAGLPGSNPVLAGLIRLAFALAWSRRAPVKVLDHVDKALKDICRNSLDLRRIWRRYQALQIQKSWQLTFLRRFMLNNCLAKMTEICALPKIIKENKK